MKFNLSRPFQKLRAAFGFSTPLLPEATLPSQLSGVSFTYLRGPAKYGDDDEIKYFHEAKPLLQDYYEQHGANVLFIGNTIEAVSVPEKISEIAQNFKNKKENIATVYFHGTSARFVDNETNETHHYDCTITHKLDSTGTYVESLSDTIKSISHAWNESRPEQDDTQRNTLLIISCYGAGAIESTFQFQGKNDMCIFMAANNKYTIWDVPNEAGQLSQKDTNKHTMNRETFINDLFYNNCYWKENRNYPIITFRTPSGNGIKYETRVLSILDEINNLHARKKKDIAACVPKGDDWFKDRTAKELMQISSDVTGKGEVAVREIDAADFYQLAMTCYNYAMAHPKDMPLLKTYMHKNNYILQSEADTLRNDPRYHSYNDPRYTFFST